MIEKTSFRKQLSRYLSLLTPNRIVGVGGLAILCAASTAALVPATGQLFVTALGQWLGGLGLNILAGLLQQIYQRLLSQPVEDEIDRLEWLAQELARNIQDRSELRQEIGIFLDKLDAFEIAEEVVKGNPSIHGWLLIKIYQDVTQYRTDFDHIHEALSRIETIVEQLQPKSSKRLFTVPLIPPQGIFGRRLDLKTLSEWLMFDIQQEDVPPVSLLGMGGIGKTTLAIALANLPTTRKSFPDGILWTELGPDPIARFRLEEWGRLLGIDMIPLPDEETCSRCLRDALHQRRAILIVDDVWDSSAGLLFKVGGPNCRTLFTTRELTIANDLVTTNRVYHVETISRDAALELLRALAPEVVNADETSAMMLCEKLEFLPLALTLAGRYLANEALTAQRRHILIQKLLVQAGERLALPQFEKRLGIKDARPSLRAILGLSVERLDRIDQERFATLALFGGEPLSWTIDAAAFLWVCSEEEAEATITRFIQRGLVERWNRRYRMHALLADFAAVLFDEMRL